MGVLLTGPLVYNKALGMFLTCAHMGLRPHDLLAAGPSFTIISALVCHQCQNWFGEELLVQSSQALKGVNWGVGCRVDNIAMMASVSKVGPRKKSSLELLLSIDIRWLWREGSTKH